MESKRECSSGKWFWWEVHQEEQVGRKKKYIQDDNRPI